MMDFIFQTTNIGFFLLALAYLFGSEEFKERG